MAAIMDHENSGENAPAATLDSVLQALRSRSSLPPAAVLRTASGAEIKKMVEHAELAPFLGQFFPSAFDTGAQRGARLLAGALALVRQLDSDALPESAAKKASEWLLPELHHLGTRGLLTVLDAILPNLSEALALPSSSAPRAYSLIPTALSHLRTVEPHDNLKTADGTPLQDGEAIVAHVVAALQAANWSEASLVPLATMLRDLNLPNTARRSLVLRFAKRFGDVEPLALPALVYQLLLLADPDGKAEVLHALHWHFDQPAASPGHATALPAVEDESQQGVIQGAVIMHIQFAVKQDQGLGTAVLKQVKQGHLPLGRFTFALLLSLARIGQTYHKATLDHLRGALKDGLELRAWTSSSPWLTSATAALSGARPEALLAATVKSSNAASMSEIVPSLLDLAGQLLDEPPPSARGGPGRAAAGGAASSAGAADGGADENDAEEGGGEEGAAAAAEDPPKAGGASVSSARLVPVPVRLARLGRSALLELFRLHSMVRPTVIDMIIDRLIGRGVAAANWVGALDELVQTQPLAVLEHTPRIKQLLEYVLALPPDTATSMLSSLLPLQRQRPELRDHLVLLLRKAMFSREEPTRLTAVHGFLLLLHTTDAGGDASEGAGGAGGSSAAGGLSSSLHFQLELLGFIRRSLTQQASIRAALYEGIVPAFTAQPHLRAEILELLAGQLAQYTDVYEAEDEPDGEGGGGAGSSMASLSVSLPIKLQRCLQDSRDGSTPPGLVEPLPQLIRAITKCILAARAADAPPHPAQAAGAGQGSSGTDLTKGLLGRMRFLAERTSLLGLRHLGLSGETLLTAKDKAGPSHHALVTFMDASIEALLDHTLLCQVGGGDGGGDGGDAPGDGDAVIMATQAVEGASSTQAPYGNADPSIECSRRLFVLGMQLRELLLNSKVPKAQLRPLPPWLRVDLSLPAASRVLSALHAEANVGGGTGAAGTQAPAKSSTSRRFTRHILKAISTRTAALAKAPSSGSTPAADEDEKVEGASKVLAALLTLIPSAEALEGKEAPTGKRNVNALTGRIEKPAKGKGNADAKAKAEEKVKSRLHLLVESIDACVGLLAVHAPAALAAALESAFPAAQGDEAEDDDALSDAAAAPAAAGGDEPMGAGDDAAAASGEGGAVVNRFLMKVVLPLVNRCLESDSYVEADAALKVATRLTGRLPAEALAAPLSWSRSEVCIGNDGVCYNSTAKALLSLHLGLTRRAATGGAPLLRVAQRIHTALGDNMIDDEEPAAAEDAGGEYQLITQGNGAFLVACALDAITAEVQDLERAFTILRRLPLSRSSDAASRKSKEDLPRGGAAVLEEALIGAQRRVLAALRLLCKAQLPATPAQPVLARCNRLFKHVTAVFKWLPTAQPGQAAASLARTSQAHAPVLRELCGEESLSSAMYGLINYVGTCEVVSKQAAAKAKAQAKLIPELVYVVDKFEAAVVTLCAKSKDDTLLALMKKATARDFRIQVTELNSKLKKLAKDKRDAEGKAEEKLAKKRKREADKERDGGKAKGGGKKKKGAAEEAGPQPPVAEGEDDAEDEMEDEGEELGGAYGEEEAEGEDEYPASMLGDEDDE